MKSFSNLFIFPAVKVTDEAHRHVEKSYFSGMYWWFYFSPSLTHYSLKGTLCGVK